MKKGQPTNQWFCDTCGEAIKSVKEGWVEWITFTDKKGKEKARDFRLVHHLRGCQFNEAQERKKDGGYLSDLPLEYFLGADGLMNLLIRIAEGQIPTEQVLEMIKRLHILGYEKARKHLSSRALRKGIIDQQLPPGFYTQSQIKTVIDQKWPDDIEALRTKPPKLNLKKGFTEDKLRQLLASSDDMEGHHILWVSHEGDVNITLLPRNLTPSGWTEENKHNIKFRYETYNAGNEYVGFEAVRDKKLVKELYEDLKNDWTKDREGYIDWRE